MTPAPTTASALARYRAALAPGLVVLTMLALAVLTTAVAAARPDVAADAPDDSPGWARPVPGAVEEPFDPPAHEWSAGHRGVDLAAGRDQAIRSPAPGAVTFAGAVAGKPVVVVAHGAGLRSTFEPAVATVPRGSTVGAGDVVARRATATGPGGAHCAAQGCVHWGVLRGEVYLDPLTLLGEDVPIVLLPTRGA